MKGGYYPFCYECGGEIFGFASLTNLGDGIYEMNDVSILPVWRHLGYGKKLLDFCKAKVLEFGGTVPLPQGGNAYVYPRPYAEPAQVLGEEQLAKFLREAKPLF